ncbi:MAG: hypothetical protein CME06_12170 [Gemmatimonadetes bacterium]|nr:hypothetical protein [Gemmatimonadota bacterium]
MRRFQLAIALLSFAAPAGAHMGLHLLGHSDAAAPREWNGDPIAILASLRGLDATTEEAMRAQHDRVEAFRQERSAGLPRETRESSWFADADDELQVGIGVRDISPPKGCPLAGYGDRLKPVPFLYQPFADPAYYSKLYKPNRGVRDPLFAKALVIDNGSRRVCLVGLDSVGLTQLIFEDVVARVRHLGLDRDALILGGSHTHGGSGDAADYMLWWFATADIFDERIYDPMVDRVVQAIEAAVADLSPARLGVASDDDTRALTRNRREGDTIVDPEIAVLRIDHPDGSPRAVVWNFAAHGTMVGSDNMRVTADCHGYAERALEDRLGPGLTAIFLNGTEGDVTPVGQGGRDDWEDSELWGNAMADVVESIRDGIVTSGEISLSGAHIFVDLPDPYMRPAFFLEPPGPGYTKVGLDGLVEENNTNFTGVRIGDAAFVSMPGEAITQIGLDIKSYGESIGLPASYVVGLANGHLGYMTTREEYWQGGYESGATFFGPETGEIMVNSAIQVLDLLAAP